MHDSKQRYPQRYVSGMYKIINIIVNFLKKITPAPVVVLFRPLYHRVLALFMAISYGFPARNLTVIGVTGTKGKSTVAEMLFTVLSYEGEKVALASTIRFAIADKSEPNLFKMTTPGRGFLLSFLHRAKVANCTYAIIEITSEAVLQYRHKFLSLDGLIVTNVQREHIERHGSFEQYVEAKHKIVHELEKSTKKNRVLISNKDVHESRDFLNASVPHSIGFSSKELADLKTTVNGTSFQYKKTCVYLPLIGAFNALNALATIKLCNAFGIPASHVAKALGTLSRIPGRVEKIDAGQDFLAIVDYAHTPDSLTALYHAFPKQRKICVLGNTGGGRDLWKRPEMGHIADTKCDEVILTNEDPYDENPESILADMASTMKCKPQIIMDRRKAIHTALRLAEKGNVVLISGKGTDPYIMGAHGKKTPWNESTVVREEIRKIFPKKNAATPAKIT